MTAGEYQLVVEPAVAKAINSLDRPLRERLQAKIYALRLEPHPSGSIKLSGESLYRIRVGNYRIIYSVEQEILTIRVVRVAHRRDVYRNL